MKVSKHVGFVLLSLFALMLYVSTLYNTVISAWAFLIAFTVFFAGAIASGVKVYRDEIRKQPPTDVTSRTSVTVFLATAGGSVVTYLIHYGLDSLSVPAPAVIASGLVGVLAYFFTRKLAVPVYCGSFVGMSSPLVFQVIPFALATVFASLLFVLSQKMFDGYGGKLGTIAMSGALIPTFITRMDFSHFVEVATPYTAVEQLIIVMLSAAAAIVTFSISHRANTGPVFSSGAVGLAGGVALPLLVSGPIGVTYAVVIIGASFVGMSGINRFKDEVAMFVAGTLFGLIFIFSAPFFNGAGGKLGTIAFVSALSVYGVKMALDRINAKTEPEC